MPQIKIQKGIPVPPMRGACGVMSAFRKLNVGDSFAGNFKHPNNLYTYAKKLKIKVTVRKQSDGKLRVWRVA